MSTTKALRSSSKLLIRPNYLSKRQNNKSGFNMRTSLPRQELFPINDSFPDPGFYDTNQNKRIPLKSTISHSVERFPLQETYSLNDLYFPPGIGDNFNDNTNMNMRWRKPIEKIDEEITPGPCDYNVISEKDIGKTNYKHVIEERKPIKIPDIPGPGLYNLVKEKRTVYSYTISRRINNKKEEITPGPCDYAKTRMKKNQRIMIGNTNVSLKGIENKDEAIKFLRNKVEIRHVVDELMKLVLEEKPEDPLEFIANHFGGRRKYKAWNELFESDNEFTL